MLFLTEDLYSVGTLRDINLKLTRLRALLSIDCLF